MELLASIFTITLVFIGILFPIVISIYGFWKRRFVLAVICLFCAFISFSGADGLASGGENLPIDLNMSYQISFFISVVGIISSTASSIKTIKVSPKRVKDIVKQEIDRKNAEEKTCPNCGESAKQDAYFCQYCGQKMREER